MSALSYHADNHFRLFKEIKLDLTQAVNTDIDLAVPTATYRGFFLEDLILVKARIGGTFGTDPQVQVRVGTTATSSVLIAATALTDVQGEAHLLTPPTTSAPFAENPGKKLFLRISTAASGQATATRARAAGIATLTTSVAHGLVPGDVIRVLTLGGTGYNGQVTVLTVPSTTSLTYASPGADEASTADTAGRLGVFDVVAFVHGLCW